MNTSFPLHHGAMLLKYSGISFISGAVNHGFFSGIRSLWTAAIGIALFVLGAWLEHRLTDSGSEDSHPNLVKTLMWGTLLSIGLGFFTGGLQHFPDSPARSSWVVPLGFALSVVALAANAELAWRRSTSVYAVVAGVLITGGSWGAYRWLEANPEWAQGGHSHGHGDSHSHATPTGLVAQTVTRSVSIHMDDTMRFTPDHVAVKAGETIRFVVHNAGAVPHEFVLGTDQEIAEHAELMRKMANQPGGHDHDHGGGAAITVAPGATGELVVTFPKVEALQMACLIPGHYEAGMKGRVAVQVEAATQTAPATPTAPSAATAPTPRPAPAHDHSSHKH